MITCVLEKIRKSLKISSAETFTHDSHDVLMDFEFQKDKGGYRFTMHQPEIFDAVRRWKQVLNEYENKDGKVRYDISF